MISSQNICPKCHRPIDLKMSNPPSPITDDGDDTCTGYCSPVGPEDFGGEDFPSAPADGVHPLPKPENIKSIIDQYRSENSGIPASRVPVAGAPEKLDREPGWSIPKHHDSSPYRPTPPADTMPDSVVQSWVSVLPYKEQTVMLLGLRGCDTMPKNGAGKDVTRALRGLVLKNASNVTGFIRRDIPPLDMDGTESCPVHWMMHTVHAAEVIGFRHPDLETRAAWHAWYLDAVHKLHMRPESLSDMRKRLAGDNGPEDRPETGPYSNDVLEAERVWRKSDLAVCEHFLHDEFQARRSSDYEGFKRRMNDHLAHLRGIELMLSMPFEKRVSFVESLNPSPMSAQEALRVLAPYARVAYDSDVISSACELFEAAMAVAGKKD